MSAFTETSDFSFFQTLSIQTLIYILPESLNIFIYVPVMRLKFHSDKEAASCLFTGEKHLKQTTL